MLPASRNSTSGRSSITRAATPKTRASATVASTLRWSFESRGGACGAGPASTPRSAPLSMLMLGEPRQRAGLVPVEGLGQLAEDVDESRVVEIGRGAVEHEPPRAKAED